MKISLKFHNYVYINVKKENYSLYKDMLTLAATGFQQTTSEDVP